jgi:hypothetical protein
MRMDRSEFRWVCPICKQWDKAKNMVSATIEGVPCRDNKTGKILQNATWMGKAHVKCIENYNKTHEPKYSIREYDENNKFLGETTPI